MISDFLSSQLSGYEVEFLTQTDINYLNDFWLDLDQIHEKWDVLLSQAFDCTMEDVRIRPGRDIDVRVSGCLFEEEDFSAFSERGIALGAKRFAVIEDRKQKCWNGLELKNCFRFSFPIDISWREIAHAAPIAEDVFQRPIRCFFVLCDNGSMGKYVNNDADHPFEVFFEVRPQ
jgi:hypothetical protein